MTKEISSLDELIVYAGDIFIGKCDFEPIQLIGNNFYIQHTLDGDTWDKKIDTRLAKYIINLQASFDDILLEFENGNIQSQEIRLKTEIKEGSSIPVTEITEILKSVVVPMTEQHTFITAITAICAVTGAYIANRYFEYKKCSKDKEIDLDIVSENEKTKQEAISALRLHVENNPSQFLAYERAPKILINSLDKEDTILIENKYLLSAEIAKKMLPKRSPKSTEYITYADGDFFLQKITYTEGEPVLEISQGETTLKTYISQLNINDSKKLLDEINTRQQEEQLPMNLKLQINVTHTQKQLKSATVIGLGEPRDEQCLLLDDILKQTM